MAKYRVVIHAVPATVGGSPPRGGLVARRAVTARCARDAACELATSYVDAGLTVDWSVRRTGIHRLGRRWSGRFLPGDDDGRGGVREPRRPIPPAGTASAAAEPPVSD